MLKKAEVIMIVSTMIISGILLSIVRNLIYKSTENYELFLIIVLCILLLNILQYFIIVYISQKNKSEKNISLMEMQIEMQKNNISDLEKNYAETVKLRHDFNNYISCAIELAGKNNDNEVVKYLSEFTDKRIKPANPDSGDRLIAVAVDFHAAFEHITGFEYIEICFYAKSSGHCDANGNTHFLRFAG